MGGTSPVANSLRGGNTGRKRINFNDITAIQFREPAGIAEGFIQISYLGAIESKTGVRGALDDENSIIVSAYSVVLAREIVAYMESKRKENKSVSQAVENQYSTADELKKFKELLDSGVITQEEFDTKKKQLLGL